MTYELLTTLGDPSTLLGWYSEELNECETGVDVLRKTSDKKMELGTLTRY